MVEVPRSVSAEEFARIYPSALVALRYAAGDLGLASVCRDLDYAISRSEHSLSAGRSAGMQCEAHAAATRERGRR